MILFMDDLLDSLGRSLDLLSRSEVALDELVFPRQVSSGENAGVAPNAPGSRPPLVVGMVDLKIQVQDVLGRWCGQVVRSVDVRSPVPVPEIAARADWLHGYLLDVESLPWFSRMCDEVIAVAGLVDSVVELPGRLRARDVPEVDSIRGAARWCARLGSPVSFSRLQRLVSAGEVPSEVVPDGRTLVRIDDVLSVLSCRR